MTEEPEVIEFEEAPEKRALIDGDVLLHMACWQKPISKAKAEARQEEIDELKEFGADAAKIAKKEKALFDAVQTYQPTIKKAIARYKHFMKTVLELNDTESFSIAIGNSKDNWRLGIHPAYKLHKGRTGGKARAPYIQDLRMWAIEEYNGHYCEGYEADDAIRTWATKLGIGNYVVVSVDKDLNLVPGHHMDPKTDDKEKRFWYMEPEDSAMFFWEQMLTGDSIDNIPGIRGIGPKKAEAILAPCSTELECRHAVVQQYDLAYGEEGYDNLMFNGQLLHIWRTKGDNWHFDTEEYEEITGSKPGIGA